ADPAIVKGRLWRSFTSGPLRMSVPPVGITRVPLPLMLPPVQVRLVTVTLLVPVRNVPLLSVSAGRLRLPSLLLKFAVPELIVNVPRPIRLPVKLTPPPLIVVLVVAL